MELTEQLSDEDILVGLFDKWWILWPANAKTAKKDALRAWEKIFKKDPGIPREDWEDFSETVLIIALKSQLNYRQRVFDKYPTPEERKTADVFVPRLPMPSTWLNGGRWQDHVPQLAADEPRYQSAKAPCGQCEQEGFIEVNEVSYCCWHYTRKFHKDHLMVLADTLKSIGLDRQPDESRDDWGDRCRQHLKGSKWGNALGA